MPRIAGWVHAEWLGAAGVSRRGAEITLRTRMNRERLPMTLLARVGQHVVGAVSLVDGEAPSQPGSVCLLSGLFVLPSWRGRGIGAELCRHAAAEAQRLGFAELGLYAVDTQGYYARLGWCKVSDCVVGVGRRPELAAFMLRRNSRSRPAASG